MKGKFGEEPKLFESSKPEGTQEFVIHGTSALLHDQLLKGEKENTKVLVQMFICSWLHPNDKVNLLVNI